jgi:putative spermidine/putrescine transport system permease protein
MEKTSMRPGRWLIVVSAILYIFILSPIALAVWMSFSKSELMFFPPREYTFSWYASLLNQTQLIDGLWLSLKLALATAALSLVLGGAAAIGLARARFRFKGFIESLFLGPLVVPVIIVGMAIYVYLYKLSGVFHAQLVPTWWALLLAHTVLTLPFTFNLLYAGMTSVNRDLELASLDMGRTQWGTMRRITIPLLKNSAIGAAIFAFIFSFGDLEISLFLVAPGQTTLPVAMTQYAAVKIDPTIAAMSTVQIILIAILMVLAARFVSLGRALTNGRNQRG